MTDFINNYVMNIAVAVMLVFFSNGVLTVRKKWLGYILSVIVVGIIGPVASIPLPKALSQTAAIVVLLLFILFMYKDSVKLKLFAFCVFTVLTNLSSMLAYHTAQAVCGDELLAALMFVIFFTIICAAFSFMISRIWKNIRFILSRSGFFAFFLLPLTQCALSILVIYFLSKNPVTSDEYVQQIGSNRTALLLFILVLMLSIVADGIFIQSFARMATGIRERERLQTLEAESAITFDYIKSMESDVIEMRRYRHDALNLMNTIMLAIDSGNIHEARELAAQAAKQVGELTGKRYCDCTLVNCILAFEEQRMLTDGIASDFSAELPEKPGTGELDLCRLLTNLLDNAREACLEASADEPRLVSAKLRIIDGFLYIVVRNNKPDAVLSLVSKKKDTSEHEHGHGLDIIQGIVARHGGCLLVSEDEKAVEMTASVEWKTE